MNPQRNAVNPLAVLVLLAGLALSGNEPSEAGALSFFPQGSKAMGMAGAFVAQADDPSAVFYNLGGLVLGPEDKKLAAGVTAWTRDQSLYQGLPPGIGAGTTGAQEEETALQPHIYGMLKLGPKTRLGFGITSPFLLDTQWSNPGDFVGRSLTTAAELTANDLTVGLSQRLGPNFGFGLGVIYRGTELTHARRLRRLDPVSGQLVDVGTVGVETDFSDGIGWTAGFKHRPSSRFAWGISYRSAIEIDYLGVGVLTQIASGNDQLDELLRVTLPFGQDLPTANSLEFPDVLTLGFAVAFGNGWRLEIDAEQTGWSSVQTFDLAFTSQPDLGISIRQDFDDTLTLRAGAQYITPGGLELRFGVARDESPQPDATVGPLLPDADSTLFTLGLGKDWLDVAFAWIDFDRRIISDQVDGLNGNYRSSAWMLGLTINQ